MGSQQLPGSRERKSAVPQEHFTIEDVIDGTAMAAAPYGRLCLPRRADELIALDNSVCNSLGRRWLRRYRRSESCCTNLTLTLAVRWAPVESRTRSSQSCTVGGWCGQIEGRSARPKEPVLRAQQRGSNEPWSTGKYVHLMVHATQQSSPLHQRYQQPCRIGGLTIQQVVEFEVAMDAQAMDVQGAARE